MTDTTKKRLIEMADGSLVERDVLNIVEKVKKYDPNLSIKYLSPERASLTDAPYALFERCPDGLERLVFTIWTLDDRVMDRLYAADNGHHNVLTNLEKNNEKVKADVQRRYTEKLAEAGDIVKSFLDSPKGRWSFRNEEGHKITMDDAVNRKHTKEISD